MSYEISLEEYGQPITLAYPNDYDFQYRFVQKNKRFYEYHYLRYIKAIGQLRKFKTVYDIGVCFGNHSVYFSRIMGCEVQAFEPNAQLYELIIKNFKTNKAHCHLHRLALGACDAQAKLNRYEDNVGRSFVSYDIEQGDETVKVMPLDEAVEKFDLSVPDFIKIDVEGHEVEVLKGANALLALPTAPDLFIEIDAKNRQLVFSMLEELGYLKLARFGRNFHFSKTATGFQRFMARLFMIKFKLKHELNKL